VPPLRSADGGLDHCEKLGNLVEVRNEQLAGSPSGGAPCLSRLATAKNAIREAKLTEMYNVIASDTCQ
jgi:hypothetical protein